MKTNFTFLEKQLPDFGPYVTCEFLTKMFLLMFSILFVVSGTKCL